MGKKIIRDTLENEERLKTVAVLNEMTVEAAREILERLLERPGISDEVNKYVFSEDRSDEFRGYVAGDEKGYQRGHETGFFKGVLLGALAGAGAVAAYVVGKK